MAVFFITYKHRRKFNNGFEKSNRVHDCIICENSVKIFDILKFVSDLSAKTHLSKNFCFETQQKC